MKILQITPSTGWVACLRRSILHYGGDPTKPYRAPIACWALVEEEDGTTRVVGMIRPLSSKLISVEHDTYAPAFEGYEYRPDVTELTFWQERELYEKRGSKE